MSGVPDDGSTATASTRLSERVGIVMMFAAVALALTVVVGLQISREGLDSFFESDDPAFFRAVASDPFGSGAAFEELDRPAETAYRYGRIGLPLVAWLLAAGRPDATAATLVIVNLAAIATIPILCGMLLARRGRDPRLGALMIVLPSLLIVVDRVYAEPLMVATLLAGFVLLDARHTRSALACFAFAFLCKETAVLAILAVVVPHAWNRRFREAVYWASSLLPGMIWSAWVVVRHGEHPLLADTDSRGDAIATPFTGLRDLWDSGVSTADRNLVGAVVIVSALAAFWAAWHGRGWALAATAGCFGALALCLGVNALAYTAETIRLLLPVHVFTAVVLLTLTRPRAAPASAR